MPPGVQLGPVAGLAQRVRGICGLLGGAGQLGDQDLKAVWGAVIAARVSWDLVWDSSWCSVPASARARRSRWNIAERCASRAAAKAGAQVERDRWHHEMTPQFDVTITRLGPGSDQASLMVTFEGPAALERLDEVELEIRDDGYTHGVGLVGGVDEQELANTIWGPYRFKPGIDGATGVGRTSPAVPMALGEWLKRALEESRSHRGADGRARGPAADSSEAPGQLLACSSR
ncbi:hypothetical protein ACWGLF_44555 [Streptomyces puniciscabiei]